MAGGGSPILSPAASEAAQRLSHMNVVSRGLGTSQSGTFAGEPARVLEQTCAGATIVARSLVHGGRGYYFTTKSTHPDPASEAIVDRSSGSIVFTD